MMDDYEPMLMQNYSPNNDLIQFDAKKNLRKIKLRKRKKIFRKAIIFGIAFIAIDFII